MDQFFTKDGRLVAPGTTVFLSHASADVEVAEAICAAVEEQGRQCWIAPRDIHPGQPYSKAITDAIGVCGLFLLLLDAESMGSPHVRREIERAGSKDRLFLVVRLDDSDPNADGELSYFLSGSHWFDARRGTIHDHLAEIVGAVLKLTKRKPGNVLGSGTVSDGSSEHDLDHMVYIGIDVGSTSISAATVTLDGERVVSHEVSRSNEGTQRPATATTLLNQLRRIIKRAIAEDLDGRRPAGIGVALPGQVDPRGGSLKFSPGLSLRNVPVKTGLASTFEKIPIRVDNDTRCAARCEIRLGTGLDYGSLACIFIGTGVGSGLAIDHKILFGNDYCAGEIGHMKIDSSGPPCNCGQVGCLETFVNGPAVVARAQAKAIEWGNRELVTLLGVEGGALTAMDVAQAADKGDEAALAALSEVGTSLGIGLANYLNIMNPEAIVLGGGLMTGLYLHLIGAITDAVERNALPQVRNTPILQSQFSDSGAAIGAALTFHPSEDWSF